MNQETKKTTKKTLISIILIIFGIFLYFISQMEDIITLRNIILIFSCIMIANGVWSLFTKNILWGKGGICERE